jgi:hypothetical protein
MSQTLLEMAKDLVMAQIEARNLSPDEMHQALQHTYASLKALQAQEDANGSVAVITPETPPEPVNWKKSITKHTVTCLECGASFKQPPGASATSSHRKPATGQGCAGLPATCCVALGRVCHLWYSRQLGAMTTGPSTGLRSLSRGVRTCSHTLRNHNPAWQERRPLCGIAPSPRSTIWQRSFSLPAACVGSIPRVSLRES